MPTCDCLEFPCEHDVAENLANQLTACETCGHDCTPAEALIPCPHTMGPVSVQATADARRITGMRNLIPGGARQPMEPKRPRGRPVGSGGGPHEFAHARAVERNLQKEVVKKIVEKGAQLVEQVTALRLPNRANPPQRGIKECKDAALNLLNQQLWNLEGLASSEGLSEDEEARLLKLLAGFNAALPKTVEQPKAKRPEDMTDEELESAT
jgi:hypothetical protein